MRVIEPSFTILTEIDQAQTMKRIENAGRVCYRSENRSTDSSAAKFVRQLIASGHESVIEHESISVQVICDRGVSHEWVRHRIASYSQESTRYCNYAQNKFGGEITFIKPCFWDEDDPRYRIWLDAMRQAESAYLSLLESGAKPQEARGVLPNSLKTEFVVTMNLREWRHFLRLRTDEAAHPQMRELACALLLRLTESLPAVFDDMRQAID